MSIRSVFDRYSIVRYVVTSGIFLLSTSCSILDAETSISLPLPPLSADGSADSPGERWQLREISSDPLVYEFKTDGSADPRDLLFVTGIQDCGRPTKDPLTPSLVRQLFIGLSDLRIRKQEHIELAGKPVVSWEVGAKMEDSPLTINSFTLRDRDCIIDFVLWSPDSFDKPALPPESIEKFSRYLESYIQQRLNTSEG